MSTAAGCFICGKHHTGEGAPGGAVHADALLYLSHAAIEADGKLPLLGHCLVEPIRHVPGIGDLSREEAQAAGHLVSAAARAIKRVTGAEHIYLFVLGHHVEHLHIHLVPRYPGTPREFWGMRVDEWPEAPHGDIQAIAEFVQAMQKELGKEGF